MNTNHSLNVRRVLAGAWIALALALLTGCGPDYTVIFQKAKGITRGAELVYDEKPPLVIGKVTRVARIGSGKQDEGGPVQLYVSVKRPLRRYVKTDSIFTIETDSPNGKPYVRLAVRDKDSPMLPIGSKVIGNESRGPGRAWATPQNAIVAVVGLVLAVGLLFLVKSFLRIGAVALALGTALIGANYLRDEAARLLGTVIPQGYRPDVVGYVASALVIYFVIAALFWILLAPFRRL